jgi:predicted NBD/HSP70 family sugar kinase
LNNFQVRNTNKKRIINFLYKNDGASKQDIMNALGLSAPTVSLIMKDLAERGLVKKAGTLESSGGRKPAANSLVYDAKLSVGVAVTNNHLRFVAIDLSENVVCCRRIREPFRSDPVYYRALAGHIEAFIAESGLERNKLLGVGIAVPGIVNAKKNLLEYSPTMGVKYLPLNVMTGYIPYPVMVDNEANLADLTEIWRLDDVEDAIYLSVNKGVGGAVIIGNKLFYGLDGRCGEFGHMTIVKGGKTCSCGKKGCLEAYCSTRMLTEPGYEDIDNFFAALKTGDPDCQTKWQRYLDHLATGINNIYTIFNSNVIIGGEISEYLRESADLLRHKLVALSTFETKADYLHFSKFGDYASAIGAALLLVDEFLNAPSGGQFAGKSVENMK